MEIIKLKRTDLKNALDLVWTVFLEFEAPDYSPQGIEEFKKFISHDSMMKQFENEEIIFWGCIVNNEYNRCNRNERKQPHLPAFCE